MNEVFNRIVGSLIMAGFLYASYMAFLGLVIVFGGHTL